jgi:hypothetical protein
VKKPPTKGPPAAKDTEASVASKGTPVSPAWRELQNALEAQRTRAGRIRVPSREEVLKRIGEKHPAAWQVGILWSRVCYGFQPELTDAWFDSVAAFRQESKQDRVFTQCIFWIVTQSLQCFY